MPVVTCTFGLDREDAARSRPALVPRPEQLAELDAPWLRDAAPELAAALRRDGAVAVSIGAGRLPALRDELRRALEAVRATELPAWLIAAPALQRLATVRATAQEYGFNLCLPVVDG